MKLKIEIESGNEDLKSELAVAAILHTLAAKLEAGIEMRTHRIRDANGNSVGWCTYDREDEDEDAELMV